MEAKLYVGNLSYETTEEALRELFMQAGGVVSVALIKDRYSGQSKGFAFVEMSSQADAQKAISMLNGHTMKDRELTVNVAVHVRNVEVFVQVGSVAEIVRIGAVGTEDNRNIP